MKRLIKDFCSVTIGLTLVTVLAFNGPESVEEITPSSFELVNTKALIRPTDINQTRKIKNVILFIGDGMGEAHIETTEIKFNEQLVFSNEADSRWMRGYVNTDSLSSMAYTIDETKDLLRPDLNESLYKGTYDSNTGTYHGASGESTVFTDSAAGGTAYATGVKVTNGKLSYNINGDPIESVVEIASKLGKKTGVLTTDNNWGATPSAFSAHASHRYNEDEIIRDTAVSPLDMYISTNSSRYQGNQAQYETLFRSNGFDVVYDANYLHKESNRIYALMPTILPFSDRSPTLSDLTAFALDYLNNEEGFFLMIEGAQIDKHSHANQVRMMMNEVYGLNNAVKTAFNWALGRNDTLIVVTADHESGALIYDRANYQEGNFPGNEIEQHATYLSTQHSRARVPFAVYGGGEEFFYHEKYQNQFGLLHNQIYIDNTDIFKLCVSFL